MTRPLIAAAFALGTLALPAQALDLTAMTEAERAAFRAEVRAYLLENPQVIMEAVAVLEQQQAEAQAQSDMDMVRVNADDLYSYAGSWVGGNPQGDVTIVEFMDYRCGYCRKAHDEVAELVQSDGNIRLILKELPILGPDSVLSSRFAIATRELAGDDAYKLMHDTLLAYKGSVTPEALTRIAADLGLDGDAIAAKMDAPEVNQIIGDTHQLAGRLQISGTPTFVMGDQMVRGYVPLDGMRQIVDGIRAN